MSVIGKVPRCHMSGILVRQQQLGLWATEVVLLTKHHARAAAKLPPNIMAGTDVFHS